MNKCNSYHKEFGKERCYGTKEIEECSCGGDEAKCNFYSSKRVIVTRKDEVTDIFSLMQKLWKTGYKISFLPDKFFADTVRIKLDDPSEDKHIAIIMRVDQNYFEDPNGVIFETINKMIEDMEDRRYGGIK